MLASRAMALSGNASVDTASNTSVGLCNKTIDNANASGIFTYHVNYMNREYDFNKSVPYSIPDPSWPFTVSQQDDELEQIIWSSTGGQNYSNDLALGYDVCAYDIGSGLPLNTIELGQDDPGDCSIMLSPQCRAAILDRTAQSALKWVSYASPPPYSNLSAGVLPTLCEYILKDVGENGYQFPKECSQESGYQQGALNPIDFEVSVATSALTGYDSTNLGLACPLYVGDKICYSVFSAGRPASYDNATRSIYPDLTAYMPVAHIDAPFHQGNAYSRLACARLKKFQEGSRVSPALLSGTPYTYGEGLGKGAIAGIAVGVILFVAIVAGLLAYLFLRRRKRQTQQAGSRTVEKQMNLPEADDTRRAELSPQRRMHEPDSRRNVPEMGEGYRKANKITRSQSRRGVFKMGDAPGKPAELGT